MKNGRPLNRCYDLEKEMAKKWRFFVQNTDNFFKN
jgi:hypothetical protein